MIYQVLTVLCLLDVTVLGQNASASCKNPTVEQRLLADDVRYASPFYVIALPKTPETEQIDNVCYTYYETGEGPFFHVMSVVYQNGSNTFYTFSKGDLSNRMGLAEATAKETSNCIYHDYTLTPICKVTVFVLYRCFISGDCTDIDIGRIAGVDTRVVLAASTKISDECRLETEENLKDTSSLEGGDYIILPQNRKPQCVTNYNNKVSINAQNALGSLILTEEDVAERFGQGNEDLVFTGTTISAPAQENSVDSKKSESDIPLRSSVSEPERKPLLSSQQESNVPRRTYADVVKSSSATKTRTRAESNTYYHLDTSC